METKQTLLASPVISRSVETDDEFDLDIRLVPHANQLHDVNAFADDNEDRICRETIPFSCSTDCSACK